MRDKQVKSSSRISLCLSQIEIIELQNQKVSLNPMDFGVKSLHSLDKYTGVLFAFVLILTDFMSLLIG